MKILILYFFDRSELDWKKIVH